MSDPAGVRPIDPDEIPEVDGALHHLDGNYGHGWLFVVDDADAAIAILNEGYDVIQLEASARHNPTPAALMPADGRRVWLWPTHSTAGVETMRRVFAVLMRDMLGTAGEHKPGAAVCRIIRPGKLGLADGETAADWEVFDEIELEDAEWRPDPSREPDRTQYFPHLAMIPDEPPRPTAPAAAPRPDKEDDPSGYWVSIIESQSWPEDVRTAAAEATRAKYAGDAKRIVDALYGLAGCDGWAGLRTGDKCFIRTVLADRDTVGIFPGVAAGTIGAMARGAWKAPVDAPADDGDDAPWVSLDTLEGEAGKAWPSHASGLIFPGRVTLLSGKAKQGKSTLTAAAVAGIITGADWLTGEVQAPGDVLWIGAAGESQAAEVRDLVTDAGADGGALARLHFMRARPAAGIKAALAKHPIPNLRAVIVDSARGLMSTDGGDEDSSDDVRRTMTVVAEIAGGEVGACAIHHMRRDRDAPVGERTRGSGDWLAVVDMVAEFDQTSDGARLTYDARRGGPADPLDLTRAEGAFSIGRGGGSPGDTGGGKVDPFQIPAPGARLAEFAQGWIMRNPESTDREYLKACRADGFKARNLTLLDARHEAQHAAAVAPPAEAQSAAAVAVIPEAPQGGPESRESTKPAGVDSRDSHCGNHSGISTGIIGNHDSGPIGESRRESTSGITESGITGITKRGGEAMQTPDANGEILITQAQGRTLLDWYHQHDREVWSVLCPGGVAVEPTEATWKAVKALMPADPDIPPADALEFCWAAEERARGRLKARLGNPAKRADILDIVNRSPYQALIDRPIEEWPFDVIRVLGSTQFGQPAQAS